MRINDLEYGAMSASQRAVFDHIRLGPRGVVQGPLRVWLHRPEMAMRAQALGAYCRFDSSLEARLSELAIITVGAHWQAGFEWEVHAPLALHAGIGAVAIEALRTGAAPVFEREDERTVYAFTQQLVADKTASAAVFGRATAVLGEEGVVDLVAIVGYYTFICMTIVAFEVPTSERDPFADCRALR